MKRIIEGSNITKMVIIVLFFLLSNSWSLSITQSPSKKNKLSLNENSTIWDILKIAESNNPGLKAAYQQWQAALALIPQARALPNPQLNYTNFIQPVETRVGPQYQKIGLMQMFPWFGKLHLRGNQAMNSANAKKEKYELTKLTLLYRTKKAYFEYYYAARTVDILKENLQLLKDLEEVIREKYRTGTASFTSLVKIQVELDKSKDRLKSAGELLLPLKAKLNSILNRSTTAPLPPPKNIPETFLKDDLPQLSTQQLTKLVKKNNPGLKSLEALIQKEQTGIRLAKKNYYPDFALGMDYIITGEARMPDVLDSSKDPLAIKLSLQIPIWGKKNRATVEEASARYQAAVDRKQEAENTLVWQLESVRYNYHDAKRKMELYKNSLLPKARQALEVTRSAFETGKADYLDFIDSQRTLLTFALAFEEAKTQSAQRLAELNMIVGKDIQSFPGNIRNIQ